MKTDSGKSIYLKDYSPPEFTIVHSELEFHLDPDNTTISARHQIQRHDSDATVLRLNCEAMDVTRVIVDGQVLDDGGYQIEENHLILAVAGSSPCIQIENRIDPGANTALSGLYKSGDMLCTQCEAEGFRRITPGLDRPDNLGTYRVKLIADKSHYPVLLCNGNLEDSGDLDRGLHYTVWHDPFAKPTYLFAIVAGRLQCLEDTFESMNRRRVSLRFYARDRDVEKCRYAMGALKRAMAWDEQVYGREYDLDLFNVVAVEDFNMGAMENKSLNIFNTKYVLADPDMATDDDFDHVEGIIGHEYFHNWSGNRVTCRDWFQLSLKEGFTVFRDQTFSADMGSPGVRRIDDVDVLRSHQFREDASPMAHPVRPDSYQEINNFYTVTVYNKGAEVVRMLHTILGAEGFRRGTDLYFDRHDGQAVTTDDFVDALAEANDHDFTQFKNWYSQAGTPRVEVNTSYNDEEFKYTILLRQSCPPTPGQKDKRPFVIPLQVALFSRQGKKLELDNQSTEQLLVLDKTSQVYEFSNISEPPIISINRGFSAPVNLKTGLDPDQLSVLLLHDDDPFNRWEAGQTLFLNRLLEDIECHRAGEALALDDRLLDAFHNALDNPTDPAFIAKLLTLPSTAYIGEHVHPIDPAEIFHVRRMMIKNLAGASRDLLLENHARCTRLNTGSIEPGEMAARSLQNLCIGYLASLDDPDSHRLILEQLDRAKCMTDSACAISLIAGSTCQDRPTVLENFYQKYQNDPLVIDKWLRAQSTAVLDDTLENVRRLTDHPGFDCTNPNKVYALILGFTHGNPACFHATDGAGYEFLVSWISKLDPVNPQVASRLVSALNGWKRYQPELRSLMKQTLLDISSIPGLSPDVSEIVSKNLA